MSRSETSRELIDKYIETELEKDYAEMDSTLDDSEKAEIVQSLDESLEEQKAVLSRKVDQVDSFTLELSRQQGLIDGEIMSIRNELNRLLSRKKAIKRSEEYFKSVILPMIIETCGNDGILKTDSARYKLYDTWGPLEITDEEMIPDEYKRYKVEIDKKKARKDVIAAKEEGNLGIAGFDINKKKRIRKS